jgi:CheY-like chemotaxis protein
VLVVDDDALIRESLSVMLFEEGYDVSTAGNGEEALHCLDQLDGNVGLILLDLTMPVMDGNTLLATLDGHARYASIPVVIISAVASRASKSASKILSKPLDFEEVLSLVQHHCGPAHQAAQVQAAWA